MTDWWIDVELFLPALPLALAMIHSKERYEDSHDFVWFKSIDCIHNSDTRRYFAMTEKSTTFVKSLQNTANKHFKANFYNFYVLFNRVPFYVYQ